MNTSNALIIVHDLGADEPPGVPGRLASHGGNCERQRKRGRRRRRGGGRALRLQGDERNATEVLIESTEAVRIAGWSSASSCFHTHLQSQH
eukprot:4800252-Pleurochrysis_carterae.AAC.1